MLTPSTSFQTPAPTTFGGKPTTNGEGFYTSMQPISAPIMTSTPILPYQTAPHLSQFAQHNMSLSPLQAFVVSGTTGSILPSEHPVAFTTVTYAKASPTRDYYAAFARNEQRVAESQDASSRSSASDEYNGVPLGSRHMKVEGGNLAGLNEALCGAFDKNAGALNMLNFSGLCNRATIVPMDAVYPSPRQNVGLC